MRPAIGIPSESKKSNWTRGTWIAGARFTSEKRKNTRGKKKRVKVRTLQLGCMEKMDELGKHLRAIAGKKKKKR